MSSLFCLNEPWIFIKNACRLEIRVELEKEFSGLALLKFILICARIQVLGLKAKLLKDSDAKLWV
jgi:hypothetical protein